MIPEGPTFRAFMDIIAEAKKARVPVNQPGIPFHERLSHYNGKLQDLIEDIKRSKDWAKKREHYIKIAAFALEAATLFDWAQIEGVSTE